MYTSVFTVDYCIVKIKNTCIVWCSFFLRTMSSKTKQWYKTNPKVIITVKYCMELGMTEKETVNVLQIIGYDLTDRTIRRIKKDLPKPNRLEQLAKKEASFFVIEAIEMLYDLVKKVKKIGLVTMNIFFDVVLGKPTSYHVKPLWSKRYLKVGHNWIRIID